MNKIIKTIKTADKVIKIVKNSLKIAKNKLEYDLQNRTKCDIIGLRKGVLNMANYTAQQIADWFLAYNQLQVGEDGAELISNLKLQKLLYYAQGSYLGITGEKLFDEPILAWKHGPVVESIYYRYRDYGYHGIQPEEGFALPDIDKDTEAILESVYASFGQFSAWKLRDMTHEEDPWKETPQSSEISTKSIKKYFVEHYIES